MFSAASSDVIYDDSLFIFAIVSFSVSLLARVGIEKLF